MIERGTREANPARATPARKSPLLLAVAVLTVLMLGAWGQGDRARAAQDDEGAGNGGVSESVTLELDGDEGVSFSGSCSLGGDRREISGQIPESFEFDVEREGLSCKIRKEAGQGNGALEVTLRGEGSRSAQRIEGGVGTVKLRYKGGAVSSSMSSSKRSGGRDERSSATDEPARGDDSGSLADRIQRMVDEILERAISQAGAS